MKNIIIQTIRVVLIIGAFNQAMALNLDSHVSNPDSLELEINYPLSINNNLEEIIKRSEYLIDSIEEQKRIESLATASAKDAANNDSLIKARLDLIGESCSIKMDYTPAVKHYIHAYAIRNSDKVSRLLGRLEFYYPIFEEYLNRYNLPVELKHLAAVESALIPTAISKSGAVGLWQFLPGTAGLFDLKINSVVDERRDIHMSTEAACKYLEYLYRIYQDWHLALASYNGGPGAVKKAIAKAGGNTNYWEIRPLMTNQMQNYVPAFIAMNYVLRYYKDFGITPTIPTVSYHDTDTLMIYKPVQFKQISSVIPISVETIEQLNPTYRKSEIPETKDGSILILPKRCIIEFIINEEKILAQETEAPRELGAKVGEKKLIKVKYGDSLHKLAIRYGCTLDDIMIWNNLKQNHQLLAGEELIVYQ